MVEATKEALVIKITEVIGGIFTLLGFWFFVWGIFRLSLEEMQLGILMMILGELVDLPERIKSK